MKSEPVFSRRVLAGWIAAAIIMFAVSLYFVGGGGPQGAVESVGPSTFSRSAIGHAGIADVLQRLGIRVVKSQYDSLEKLGSGSVLVIAEPRLSMQSEETMRTLLKAKSVLLVLPKWTGRPSQQKAGWIDGVDLKSQGEAEWALARAVQRAQVIREDTVAQWSTNALGPLPSISEPVQLMKSDRLRPIVAAGDRMLVGELRDGDRRVWILADPDVIANFGIARDDNAVVAVALINGLRGTGGNVVFDETVHGYAARPASPLLLLFQFPFVVATAQGAVAVLLLLWATTIRFGAPQAAPPPLSAGRQGLLSNMAKLLEFAGHQRVMVGRYVQATIRDVARQIRAPRGMSEETLLGWLGRVGTARGVSIDCTEVLRRADELSKARHADAAPLVQVARDIHQWKQEIIDGRSRHSRNH